MTWLDSIPLWLLGAAAIVLAAAPFVPEPHLWQKLRLLSAGELVAPLDIFDLVFHATLPILFGIRLARAARTGRGQRPGQ